jgi:hypothetical protein
MANNRDELVEEIESVLQHLILHYDADIETRVSIEGTAANIISLIEPQIRAECLEKAAEIVNYCGATKRDSPQEDHTDYLGRHYWNAAIERVIEALKRRWDE